MTVAYLYEWTEISTGKWYVGSRTRKNCHPDDRYICSSRVVKEKILKNPNNWNRKILVIGEPKYIRNLEALYLNRLNAATNSKSYNQNNADGKFHTIGKDPWNKGKPTGHLPWNKGLPTEEQPFYGKTFSEKTKKKLSENQKGEKNSMFGKQPWNKGNPKQLKWFTNGTENIQCQIGKEPTGFVAGRIINYDFGNYDKSAYRWYNNGKVAKRFIPGNEPEGFVLGRKLPNTIDTQPHTKCTEVSRKRTPQTD